MAVHSSIAAIQRSKPRATTLDYKLGNLKRANELDIRTFIGFAVLKVMVDLG